MRLWIDTDIGTDVDDALAIAYALRHPGLDVVGISTVFGDLDLRGALVDRLLAAAGGPDVPVLPGLSVPLTEGRHGLMFGHEGRAVLEDPSPVLRTEHEPGGADGARSRVDALARAVAEAGAERILAIGPLTNLAALVRAEVELPPLTIMGGKFDPAQPSGVSSQRPEWNWYCDPVAVQDLLAVGPDLDATVVPAEVTYQTVLPSTDIDALAAGDALHRQLAALSREWLRAQVDDFEFPDPRVVLHDPLAAAVILRPELCRWQERTVTVDERGQSTEADPGAGGATIRAAVDVDPAELTADLLAVLGVDRA